MIAALLADRCTACQRCVAICPADVFDAGHSGPPQIARAAACQTCFACELYCEADALFVHPDVFEQVTVNESRLRDSGLLGVYRRDSGWHEWQDDPRYANRHWLMDQVFARGRQLAESNPVRGDAHGTL